MQVLVRNSGGNVTVEGIDPTDGACFKSVAVEDGEQVYVTSAGSTSPADVTFGEVEAIPVAAPEGEGTGDAANGDADAEPAPEPSDEAEAPEALTSAESELPLYKVDGDTIPENFAPSGLEDPNGVTLYHYGADEPGEAGRGGGEGVSLYADADDGSQPVCKAETAE